MATKPKPKPKPKAAPAKPTAKAKKPAVKTLTTAQKLDAIGIDAICERIADCVTLQVIADDAGVSKYMLLEWLGKHANQYARARESQADKMAEDILALADKCRTGVKTTTKADGSIEMVTADMVERARLQIDARKSLAGKMAPKQYGEKLALGGADDLPAIKTTIDVTKLSTEVLEQLMAAKDASADTR